MSADLRSLHCYATLNSVCNADGMRKGGWEFDGMDVEGNKLSLYYLAQRYLHMHVTPPYDLTNSESSVNSHLHTIRTMQQAGFVAAIF